ncbi:hypothetical protein BLNAU_6956 [Blattamonas nauphoetae]|uniref:RanBD1 domain-containing protein n=1 Tax=Blattamonas nauphoetae TaxID=2049346 RepID=A0ABQ9Y2R8_9EUKA|nr:hypothetical protein BLNAU_6956 [Blattamonas nauphoetae]
MSDTLASTPSKRTGDEITSVNPDNQSETPDTQPNKVMKTSSLTGSPFSSPFASKDDKQNTTQTVDNEAKPSSFATVAKSNPFASNPFGSPSSSPFGSSSNPFLQRSNSGPFTASTIFSKSSSQTVSEIFGVKSANVSQSNPFGIENPTAYKPAEPTAQLQHTKTVVIPELKEPLQTGEEDETNLWSGEAKLFHLTKEASKEGEKKTSRLLLRSEAVLSLILNMRIHEKLDPTNMSPTQIRLRGINYIGEESPKTVDIFLLVFRDQDTCSNFLEVLKPLVSS